MRYANLKYGRRNGRINIGDDIQILAIENLYRHAGIEYEDVVRIELSDLWTYDGEPVILPISFPIISYHSDLNITCFSPKIHPVFLALSILSPELSTDDVAYLKQYEPIGCREFHTYRIMQKYGIDAYLFGCMTLTFPCVTHARTGGIICVDFPEGLKTYLPQEYRGRCQFLSNAFDIRDVEGDVEVFTKKIWEIYEQAELIITSRMHVALPCIAKGIPVIFAKDRYSYRFNGIDCIVKVYSEWEYADIDWTPERKEIQTVKELLLSVAQKRIQLNDQISEERALLQRIYVKADAGKDRVENMEALEEFMEKRSADGHRQYVIWSVTQTAELVYRFMQEHYGDMCLCDVIDKYKRVRYHGIDSKACEDVPIDKMKDALVLVCSDAAIPDAQRYFMENAITDYYFVCLNGMAIGNCNT